MELLKGSNGTLYGSDGQAGSLNLISEKPVEGVSSELTFRGGSFNTYEEIAKLNAGTKDHGLVTTVTRLDSRGLTEDGNYENTTIATIGKVKLSEEVVLTPMFRMISAMNDLDTSPALNETGDLVPNLPTASNRAHAQSYFYGLSTDVTPCDAYSSKFSLYANVTDRSYFFDFGDGFKSLSDYKGESYNFDWQNNLKIDALNSNLLAGLEVEHQEFNTDSDGLVDEGKQDRYAVYAKNRFAFFEEALHWDVGARVTHISRVDRTLPTFETSAVFKVPVIDTRMHSSLTQGFRAPSLFELMGSIVDYNTGNRVVVGNRNLKPEESLSFDVGFTQPLFDEKLEFDLTFFNISSDETIYFDFAQQAHYNVNGGENQGLEYSLTATPIDWLKLRGAYTYLAKANVGDERIQRRPYNVFALASSVRAGIATWYTELRYRDSADIAFFGAESRYREDSYLVLDTSVTVPVEKNIELFVRGNNLFDTEYTESGYRMPGISFFGGIKLKLG
jgi:vitamin B12 transporter